MFEGYNGDFDIQKTHINDKGDYVITAGITDNGILGKTDVDAKIFPKNTITVDMFGYAFLRPFKYKIVTHARVFSLKPKNNLSEKQGLFIANSFNHFQFIFGYENMCSWNKIKDSYIKLPICKDGTINFAFMEKFITELEATHLAELEAYLNITGLKDYKLTDYEKQVLKDFEDDKIKWGEFRIGDLLDRVKTKKLHYKAKDLPQTPTEEYDLPCLTSSFNNQGLNYYVPEKDATIIKNVISIPSNSDVYRAYFQSRKFTVLSDAYAIDFINSNKIKNEKYLFTVTSINKVTNLSIYSYKNKLGGWNVVKNKKIFLPIINNEPNYEIMEIFIKAIEKLVIKDVVLYSNNKLKLTKQVVENKQVKKL